MWRSYGLHWIKRCNTRRGVGSDTDQGGTLDLNTYKIVGAPEPLREVFPESAEQCQPSHETPGAPEYLSEMKDAVIIQNTIHALSPRIVAVHGPTGTGKSTVFPAIAHWAKHAQGLKRGLTVCAQPRRILAQQLCERVRSNRKMWYKDKTVGYMIARESCKDSSSKLLYCKEAVVALMMQTRLMTTEPAQSQDETCDFLHGPSLRVGSYMCVQNEDLKTENGALAQK